MKKSFKDNPAFQFISEVDKKEDVKPEIKPEPKEGYKLNPLYIKTKTRRLQLIVKPSVYEKIKAKSMKQKLSVNEYIHQLLEKDIE